MVGFSKTPLATLGRVRRVSHPRAYHIIPIVGGCIGGYHNDT